MSRQSLEGDVANMESGLGVTIPTHLIGMLSSSANGDGIVTAVDASF